MFREGGCLRRSRLRSRSATDARTCQAHSQGADIVENGACLLQRPGDLVDSASGFGIALKGILGGACGAALAVFQFKECDLASNNDGEVRNSRHDAHSFQASRRAPISLFAVGRMPGQHIALFESADEFPDLKVQGEFHLGRHPNMLDVAGDGLDVGPRFLEAVMAMDVLQVRNGAVAGVDNGV